MLTRRHLRRAVHLYLAYRDYARYGGTMPDTPAAPQGRENEELAMTAPTRVKWGELSERGRDNLVGEVAMGLRLPQRGPRSFSHPHYTTDISAAWQVVKKIGEREPGWRFSLLGGDVSYAYKRDRDGLIAGLDRTRLEAFGWKAEWFGHMEPTMNTGQRHGEAYAVTAPEAICIAALRACGIEVET